MPSPVCSCITAGFGVKFLRRYRISIPHGLLSPVGHPGYKNDRGERVSSKTGDRSIYAAGPPSAKAGGDLPTMRRHNTCRAKKHSTHRRVSPTLATGTEKRARRPHPASPRMPRSIRTKESGWVPPWACRIYWFSLRKSIFTHRMQPMECGAVCLTPKGLPPLLRTVLRLRAIPGFTGKRGAFPRHHPLQKENGSDKKGLQHLPEQLEDNIFSRYVRGIQTKASIFPNHRTPTARTVKTRQRAL